MSGPKLNLTKTPARIAGCFCVLTCVGKKKRRACPPCPGRELRLSIFVAEFIFIDRTDLGSRRKVHEEDRDEGDFFPITGAGRVVVLLWNSESCTGASGLRKNHRAGPGFKNASIAGATITVVDERTNVERTTTSNADGSYQIVALRPSSTRSR